MLRIAIRQRWCPAALLVTDGHRERSDDLMSADLEVLGQRRPYVGTCGIRESERAQRAGSVGSQRPLPPGNRSLIGTRGRIRPPPPTFACTAHESQFHGLRVGAPNPSGSDPADHGAPIGIRWALRQAIGKAGCAMRISIDTDTAEWPVGGVEFVAHWTLVRPAPNPHRSQREGPRHGRRMPEVRKRKSEA